MTTLDDEWLGDCEPCALDKIARFKKEWWTIYSASGGARAVNEALDVISSAAAEIRALRLLVKNQSKRIDELEGRLSWTDPDLGDPSAQ